MSWNSAPEFSNVRHLHPRLFSVKAFSRAQSCVRKHSTAPSTVCCSLGTPALTVPIIVGGTRPKANYDDDMVDAPLCHCAPVHALPGPASQPQGEGICILLSSFSRLVCEQKLGKTYWVPCKPDRLWIMTFGWQSLGTRMLILQTITLAPVLTSFPPASPVCGGFFLWQAVWNSPGRISGFLSVASKYHF